MSKGLGRGFDALIPQNFDSSLLADSDEKITKVALSRLRANPEQPRLHFDEQELAGLADSIRTHGILQPLVVTPVADDYYVIAGERRWRAAKLAGLESVPAIVRTAKQLERLELALVENVQRVNLSPLEQAASIEYLHEQFSMDYAAIGKRLGKAASTVQNTARLMRLSDDAKQALRDKQITEGHARAILGLKTSTEQDQLLRLILKSGWSVRQAERYVIAQRQGATSQATAKAKVATSNAATKQLAKTLGTPVSLRRTAKGGKLEITFKSEEELARITALLARL